MKDDNMAIKPLPTMRRKLKHGTRIGKSQDGIDMEDDTVKRSILQKKKLMERSKGATGRATSLTTKETTDEVERMLPPGQALTKSWIVLDLGTRPPPGPYHDLWSGGDNGSHDGGEWGIKFFGGKGPKESTGIKLGLAELKELGTRVYSEDWHCVTGWSAVDLTFTGVPFQTIISRINPGEGWVGILQVLVLMG
ncbi:unnamed protein product [Choristocarpus tenellus]